jgi:hypothetical protein
MKVREQLSLTHPAEGSKIGPGSPADLVEADRLISDLAALVDAGVVSVCESVLGPARYGVAPDHEPPAESSIDAQCPDSAFLGVLP